MEKYKQTFISHWEIRWATKQYLNSIQIHFDTQQQTLISNKESSKYGSKDRHETP